MSRVRVPHFAGSQGSLYADRANPTKGVPMPRGGSCFRVSRPSLAETTKNFELLGSDINSSLASSFDEWMISQDYAASTRRTYNRTLRLFVAYLGPRSVRDINHRDIRRFLIEMGNKGLSVSGLNHHLCALRGFFDFLFLGGVVDSLAPRLVKGRRPRRMLPRVLTEEEVRRLVEATCTARERAIVELFYGSGCRMGELVSMKIEDIDFSARRILVNGKTRDRFVYFGEQADCALRQYIADRRRGYLFLRDMKPQHGCVVKHVEGPKAYWYAQWRRFGGANRKKEIRTISLGRMQDLTREQAEHKFREILRETKAHIRPFAGPCPPVVASTISRCLRKIAFRAGLGHVSSHMLRHSFATHLLDHGADVRFVQELMGHRWLTSTQIYTHVSSTRLTETIARHHPRGNPETSHP